ncbi:hypothetical protein HPB51_005488 [Rhipicephalus microplus]|uniref:Uncharacterized protein n=1 Tax=Rhipicephalus microplus TaxID=6941 RepID=A0A9J6EXW2_RHIMP|nr:hypothetical protein HPB51_005488 [Rhipicephalus microplus]
MLTNSKQRALLNLSCVGSGRSRAPSCAATATRVRRRLPRTCAWQPEWVLTWVFGFVAAFVRSSEAARTAFTYLFIVCNTLQVHGGCHFLLQADDQLGIDTAFFQPEAEDSYLLHHGYADSFFYCDTHARLTGLSHVSRGTSRFSSLSCILPELMLYVVHIVMSSAYCMVDAFDHIEPPRKADHKEVEQHGDLRHPGTSILDRLW